MEVCDYSYSKKKQLQKIVDSSFLHERFSPIKDVLFKLKMEAETICNSVGAVSQKAKFNYEYYWKCVNLAEARIAEVNDKIRSTPRQIVIEEYVKRSDGTVEKVKKYYSNPEISVLESRRIELEEEWAYIKGLLEELREISETYGRIYDAYLDYSNKISDAERNVKSVERQTETNLEEVYKCINSAERAIRNCLSIRMDRKFEVRSYIKSIEVE